MRRGPSEFFLLPTTSDRSSLPFTSSGSASSSADAGDASATATMKAPMKATVGRERLRAGLLGFDWRGARAAAGSGTNAAWAPASTRSRVDLGGPGQLTARDPPLGARSRQPSEHPPVFVLYLLLPATRTGPSGLGGESPGIFVFSV